MAAPDNPTLEASQEQKPEAAVTAAPAHARQSGSLRPQRILCVEGNHDGTVGGSYYVLYDLVVNLDKTRFHPIVLFYFDHFLVPELRQQGIETHVVKRALPYVPSWKHSTNLAGKVLYQLMRPVQRLINIFKTLIIPAFRWRSFLRRHDIDLVDLNNSVTRNHDWMLAAALANIPCMTHEMGINTRFSPLSRFFAARMKAIVPVSKAVEDNMRRHGLEYRHIHTVHNGIDLARYRLECMPEELRAELGLGQTVPVIGVIGNIKYWKGQETVIRATHLIKQELPAIQCLLVGGVSPLDHAYFETLKRLCNELNIEGNVQFTGFRNNPIDFMNLMDIVIHPSIDPEPFGIVNLEAMSLKKPVISTTIGAPVEIFEHGVSGLLVEPGNPQALAQACIDLLKQPEKARAIGQAAYERFTSHFTIEKMVQGNEQLYARILFDSSNHGHA